MVATRLRRPGPPSVYSGERPQRRDPPYPGEPTMVTTRTSRPTRQTPPAGVGYGR
ncbi:hypothetical protein SAMN05216259_105136 [Actinacidiphila guanduensis]|uniref:Uncharacterized protein n=1 Tax=Actinacidiphila guanduensis TaxID=310781 RepID=A0A1H0DA94_9ACTN|nr:hypothetical protein SAMN05216259_105136 [Actinacidiphila guanduensis]